LRSITRDVSSRLGLVFPLRKAALVVRDGRLVDEVAVYSGWANADKLKRFVAGGCTPLTDADGSSLEFYLSDRGVVYYRRHREGLARNIVSVLRNVGTTEKMRSELESAGIYFDYPKPCELLQALIQIGGASENDLVIDFFAGSGSTADAVLRQNAEDGGHRRFLLVQLPEPTGRDDYEHVSDITRKRIRTAMETTGTRSGFRDFALSESNFAQPAASESLLDLSDSTLAGDPDWDAVAAEVLLKEGVPLDTAWMRRQIAGADVVVAAGVAVVLSLQNTDDLVSGVLNIGAKVVVFMEDGFAGADAVKANGSTNAKNLGIVMKTV
jgi:adenine-specific DNA-methyltransferase